MGKDRGVGMFDLFRYTAVQTNEKAESNAVEQVL
jgi:hypothetical protein